MNEESDHFGGDAQEGSGKISIVVVERGKTPYKRQIDRDLRSMQSVVGGLIEQVCPFDDHVSIICNEEGKLEGLPLNRALRDENGKIYDIIAGTFFVVYSPPDSETFESMPDELSSKYIELFRYPEFIFIEDGELNAVKYSPDSGCKVS